MAFAVVIKKLTEMNAKMNMLMSSNSIEWSQHFNEEINHLILTGDFTKASTALRKKTGLSLNFCLKVIQDHAHKVA